MNGYAPEAYSMLQSILARQNLSVLALQRKLLDAGVAVNIKSLYRLTDSGPLQKLDLLITSAICKTCNIALSDLIVFERPKAQLRRIDTKSQARLDVLMSRNNEGLLSTAEQKEFEVLAERAHEISMDNARTLLAHRRRKGRQSTLKKKSSAPKRAIAGA